MTGKYIPLVTRYTPLGRVGGKDMLFVELRPAGLYLNIGGHSWQLSQEQTTEFLTSLNKQSTELLINAGMSDELVKRIEQSVYEKLADKCICTDDECDPRCPVCEMLTEWGGDYKPESSPDFMP